MTAALDAAVSEIVSAVSAADLPLVLIDGRSGSGKSTLAHRLVEAWDGPVQLIALDALYPGWDGLAAGAETVRVRVLEPYARGEIAHWQRWDWADDRYAETVAVDPSLPLVVEGSGLLIPASAALAGVRVWMESPEISRRERALERDGDTYRPHWERWARQEDAHLAQHRPVALSTLRVDVP